MDPTMLANLVSEYTYLIMAPAIFVFGPLVSLAAGVLLRLDVINFVPTVLALATGELAGDVLWYWVGRKYGESFIARYGRFVGITHRSVTAAKALFIQHHDIIIFTSKITAGLGFAIVILFTAGLSKVPFRRYMMLNIAGQFLWTAGLLSIGYFLGHIFLKVSDAFEKTALFSLVVIVLISIVGFGRYLRSRFTETPPQET